ncbi:unnamed protein product [Lactuca virosa]|uniref:Uncharacterized protein n=1 Tax=Lactuca virosa TaxID=75947 RepID=A0AAU9M2Q7_9ASTR|nr:unnamed protein product [Lactuca virosa]
METKMNADPWANLRFQLWSVSSEPPKNTPLVEYGKANDKRFTIRVVHGGFFTDYPEHRMATVDDGIAYIRHMLNMTIPREKMEDAIDMAKENVIAWKNVV